MDLFANIFTPGNFSFDQFLLCLATALVAGLIISLMDTLRGNTHSKSFVVTVALIPSIVCVILLAVGNNIGAGIAVAGAFSLVRFRSIPGTAEEIGFIFLAMATGLLIGIGYLAYAIIFALVVGGIYVGLASLKYGSAEFKENVQILKVTIPENLEYNSQIETVVDEYTSFNELINMRSVNMGSMFRLTYRVILKDKTAQKRFIDALRVRNGNLEISISREINDEREL